MSDDFPFKIETLLEQCGGNKEIGKAILDEFLIQANADSTELESCISSGNLTQVGKVGHRLKGTSGVLGAGKLYSLCAAIETAGKGNNVEEVAKIFPELKMEMDRCVAAVPTAKSQL